jgi:hypothetical protein
MKGWLGVGRMLLVYTVAKQRGVRARVGDCGGLCGQWLLSQVWLSTDIYRCVYPDTVMAQSLRSTLGAGRT